MCDSTTVTHTDKDQLFNEALVLSGRHKLNDPRQLAGILKFIRNTGFGPPSTLSARSARVVFMIGGALSDPLVCSQEEFEEVLSMTVCGHLTEPDARHAPAALAYLAQHSDKHHLDRECENVLDIIIHTLIWHHLACRQNAPSEDRVAFILDAMSARWPASETLILDAAWRVVGGYADS